MQKVKYPNKYSLYFIKDSLTPRDFIKQLLLVIFDKSETEYLEIYTILQNNNQAFIGTYIKEIAILKKELCFINAEKHDFPLIVEIREEIF